MKYTDEELSAFLDSELPGVRMEEMRETLSEDEALADRLADMVQVDTLVRSQAQAIDKQPLPDAVWRMLKPRRSKASRVVSLADWRQSMYRLGSGLRAQAAIAASLALVVGLVAGQWLPNGGLQDTSVATPVAAYLDRIPSGESVNVDGSTELESRFSFVDRHGLICRQYRLVTAGQASENVACREAGNWTRVATALSSQIYRADEFQTAGSEQLLESAVQNLMQGSPLSLDEEARQLGQTP